MSHRIFLAEGARIVGAGLKRKLFGAKRYRGSAKDICEQICLGCFDEKRRCYQTSLTSYAQFWARDFGRCAPALLDLGFERQVGETYAYALCVYERFGRFALVITPRGELLEFPLGTYSPDGFAFFLMGLAHLADGALVKKYRGLLEREITRFYETVVDPRSGLVRSGIHFSEAQDYVVRSSSCYSNVMCFVAQRSIDALGLSNPLAGFDYPELIPERYFEGRHFCDDERRRDYISGDASILPFWSGLFGWDDQAARLFARVLRKLDADGINAPLPARYGNTARKNRDMIFIERFNRWQRDAVWTCLGIHVLETLERLDRARFCLELKKYEQLVEEKGCFPEVLDGETEELYEGPFYMAEDSMLWAANLWRMLERPIPKSSLALS